MNSMEIIIEGLSKNYGHVQALHDVSLRIKTGMFGLLGRNGAGKTTLMRILATILNKSEGHVNICGMDIGQAKGIRNIVGYLPQEFSFYPGMKVYEALDYLGLLSGMSAADRRARIALMLEMVNLSDVGKRKVKALSGGMKRRLGIAQALLHDPKVLIVDEPTAGLDPEERVRFRNLLSETAENRIVILSTHIVEDIERTCERLAVLEAGEILFDGALHDFTRAGERLEDAYLRRVGGLP